MDDEEIERIWSEILEIEAKLHALRRVETFSEKATNVGNFRFPIQLATKRYALEYKLCELIDLLDD